MPFSVDSIAGLSAQAFSGRAKRSGGLGDAHTWPPGTGRRPPACFTPVTERPLEVCSFPSLPAWTGFKPATSRESHPSSIAQLLTHPVLRALSGASRTAPCCRTAALEWFLKERFCFSGLEPKILLGVTHIHVSRTTQPNTKFFFFFPPLIKLFFSQVKCEYYHHSKLRTSTGECCQWNLKSTWNSFTLNRKYHLLLDASSPEQLLELK